MVYPRCCCIAIKLQIVREECTWVIAYPDTTLLPIRSCTHTPKNRCADAEGNGTANHYLKLPHPNVSRVSRRNLSISPQALNQTGTRELVAKCLFECAFRAGLRRRLSRVKWAEKSRLRKRWVHCRLDSSLLSKSASYVSDGGQSGRGGVKEETAKPS